MRSRTSTEQVNGKHMKSLGSGFINLKTNQKENAMNGIELQLNSPPNMAYANMYRNIRWLLSWITWSFAYQEAVLIFKFFDPDKIVPGGHFEGKNWVQNKGGWTVDTQNPDFKEYQKIAQRAWLKLFNRESWAYFPA